MGRKHKPNIYEFYDEYFVIKIGYKDMFYDCFVSNEDYKMVSMYNWRVTHKKNKVYVVTGEHRNNNQLYLHNLIMGSTEKGYEIDHINGESLDNRRTNLRIVTRQENIDTMRVTSKSKIGIRGVCFSERDQKYKADFKYHGIRFYFPEWNTIEEAIWCRKTVEEYFGLSTANNNPVAKSYYHKIGESTKIKVEEITNRIINKTLGDTNEV